MYVNYEKHNFCPTCVKKYTKDVTICLECHKPLRTKRRRIISDYLEHRAEKEFLKCPKCGYKYQLE